jgi:excisionase family DNA binding protein
MSDQRHYATVRIAAAVTGVSDRTIRYWIASGKLPAVAGDSGKLVLVADVERLAGHRRQADGNGNVAESVTVATTGDGATHQLEVIRDTLIKPHLETIERQTATIADQAETIGRVTAERDQARIQAEMVTLEREQIQAERDALQARMSALEERHAESPMQPSSAPQTAIDAAIDTPWWQFWRR